MIEMLGVLAIIGVLSAGGIWGYTVAMDNHKANKFISDVKNLAMSANSIFIKPPRAWGIIYADKLYALGVIPEDWHKSLTGTCGSGGSDWTCTMKHPWNAAVVVFFEESATGAYNWTFASGRSVSIKAPYSRIRINMYSIPKKACVKIFTYDWRSFGPEISLIYGGDYTKSGLNIEAPLSVAEAERLCTDNLGMGMQFYVQGRVQEL